MSSKRNWVSFGVAAVSAFGLVGQAAAQPSPLPPVPPQDTVFFLSNTAPLPALGGKIDIIRSDGDALGPLVKGKPYSARSITESTQTLADGNRITQRNEARIYRDSEGRTRREQTLGGVGSWQAAGEPMTMITINDPVADKSYTLDPGARTAREIRPFRVALAHADESLARARTQLEVDRTAAGAPLLPLPPPGATRGVNVLRRVEAGGTVQIVTESAIGVAPFATATLGADEPAEDLGEQILEGLLVQGTRLMDTIPAGAMGNERPIEIVTERWYSKDIEAVVLHRHFDPRFGETTYKLVNVVREEPSPELFQLPQGYDLQVDRARPVGRMPPAGGAAAVGLELERRSREAGSDAR